MFSLTTHFGAYIEHQWKEVWGTSPRVQALDDGSKNHKENKSKILASNFACDTHKWFKRGNVETLLELHIYMIKLLTTNIESYA